MVHGARTTSCELNALHRFWTAAWKTAFPIYLGLNALRFLRPRRPRTAALRRALLSAARSSAFLGLFVGLFWYALCAVRTRLAPLLLLLLPLLRRVDLENLAVKAGCALCGWSILAENRARRTEIMFFVLPRALALVCPRLYPRELRWIETATFAASTGVVLAALAARPQRVRGVLGRLLSRIFV